MKIVVTGALGHIGSRLIRELPLRLPDVEVVMIDSLATQRYASLFDLPSTSRYQFVEGNVLTDDLAPHFVDADVVVHLAAITDAEASVEQKERVDRENFSGTERVARACLLSGSNMIFPSSTSVYGTQRSQVDEDCSPAELKPQSPYAETKLREEALLASLAESEGLRQITFRFGTIVGPSPGMRFHTAVNKFCWQAAMRQPLPVWRTALDQKRPYLDLDDAVAAICFAIEQKLFDGRVYNVVTANRTIREITEMIRDQTGDLKIELVDSPIMNQLSYEVVAERFAAAGFVVQGDLRRAIGETLALLRAAGSTPRC
ncbi:MAG: NAD-dependent epimerase/dehydratase family protein [Planctomycetota bacterium]|nr:MAG: NAD-dependent epimerase/dehydratase family protein [Planctomycetota bacterium]REK48106.1 MAG: NAD-dependent epimerase/dehydratase family protein [Planctomycetota bacterium]